MIPSPREAFSLLERLGAPPRLRRHAELVLEAGELLLLGLAALGVSCDSAWVRAGVILHDTGKILFPKELSSKGNQHEPAGEALLLQNQIAPKVARCCLSHARWSSMQCSLEELLVALSDKLWKGKREEPLELAVIDQVASRLQVGRWDIFASLDDLFEKIAQGATDRLSRS